MKSFKEFLSEEGIDYFIVEMPVRLVPRLALLKESQWVNSGKKDWMLRVDPENPDHRQQRHVHICKAKHTSSKDMQASWNQDGTKHDKGTFNQQVGQLDVVQTIAKQALGLSPETKLQESSRLANLLWYLNESSGGGEGFPPLFIILQEQ